MKKLLVLLLVFMLVFSVACSNDTTEVTDEPDTTDSTDDATDEADATDEGLGFKIGILTGTVSQNEEEYRAAENVVAKYGEENVVLMTYPDKFMDEQETTISNVVALASNPDVKAIIIVQAVPGISAGIEKARELRDDILFIAGVPGEDPSMIAEKADLVFATDELSMGTTIIEQAKAMGATTFVHYSFPRHMSYALLAARRDLFKENCDANGIEFVDATAPDPTGDAGVTGAQQFILEDVPRMVAEYGKDTAFFSTNCSMQVPLIESVLDEGALYPQPCCPSPYHGFPSALGIEIPEDKKGDIDYAVEAIKAAIAEKGGTGRLSTWPVPVNMMFVEAGADYAVEWAQGGFEEKVNVEKVAEHFKAYAGVDVTMNKLVDGDTTYENYLMVLLDFLTF